LQYYFIYESKKHAADANGLCKITPPNLCFADTVIVGNVPKLKPHTIIRFIGIFNHFITNYKSSHKLYSLILLIFEIPYPV
jgi:hypothetical protein